MLKKAIFLFLMLATTLFAEVQPWVSLSSLWGQGNSGVAFKQTDNLTYFLRYDFVWNFDESDFSYHQVAPSCNYLDITSGMRYRWQNQQDEVAPFIGYFNQWRPKFPCTLYNEIEYRFNPVINDNDYTRTRTLFTLYMPDAFYKKHSVRPYIAADIFTDWREADIEKTRLILGYIMKVGNVKGTLYAIPWRYGEKEEEWKDVSWFGASAILNF